MLAKCIVIFRKRSTRSEVLDIFYCGHVTNQIWAWLETFKGNEQTRQTLMPIALQEPKLRRFWDFLSNRLLVKFLPPLFLWSICGQTWNLCDASAKESGKVDNLLLQKTNWCQFLTHLSFYCNEFRHYLVKVICRSTRLSPRASTATLTMWWQKFMINNKTDT